MGFYLHFLLLLNGLIAMSIFSLLYGEEDTLEPMVVVESRTPQPLSETSPWVSKLSSYDLKERQIDNLADALRSVPGMSVFRSGQSGAQASLFSRGSNSDHTTFLFEGRKLNGGFSGSYNLGQIPINTKSSLEILRGASSVQYGAEGIGGAIMIRNDSQKKREGNWRMELGSNQSINGGLDVGFNELGWYTQIGVSMKATENEQPFSGYDNQSATFVVSKELDEVLKFDLVGTGFISEVNYPGNTKDLFNPYPVEGQVLDIQDLLISPGLSLQLDEWKLSTYYSFSEDELNNRNISSDTCYVARTHQLELLLNGRIYEAISFLSGAAYEKDKFLKKSNQTNLTEVDENPDTKSVFTLISFSILDDSSISLGGRLDDFSNYGNEATWSATLNHEIFKGLDFLARFAKSYSPPQANDLYGIWGEPSLSPEKADSWETGIKLKPSNWLDLKITYFETNFEELIAWDGISMSNIGLASARGLESSLTTNLGNFSSHFSLSYLKAEDSISRQRLLRRPKTSANYTLIHSTEFSTVGMSFTFSEDVIDLDGGNFSRIQGEDYQVIRLFGNYKINDGINLSGRIENLLDQDYEEVDGYPALGRGIYAGISFSY